jgi:hypothetical protein
METEAVVGTPSIDGFGEEAKAPVGAIRPTKLRYTHEAVIDQILANPGVTQNQLAAMFGYTPGWLSTVMGSDAFKAKLAERREEMVDPVLRMTLEERMRGMVEKSLEVLSEKLSQPALQVPDNLALRAMELGAKGLGFGGTNVKVDIHNQIDLRGAIEEGQARRAARLAEGLAIDGELAA